MKISATLLLSALALAAAPTVLGQGAPPNKHVVRTDLMTGYQETPGSISSTGSGEFVAEIDDGMQTISYVLTYSNIEGAGATQAHIHFGARSTAVTGNIAAFLCGGGGQSPCPAVSGTVTGMITAADIIGPAAQGIEPGSFDELVRAIRSGVTYVNVHSNRWPGGEIRGQISDRNERQGR
jgi:hypothetical protein